MRRTVLLLACLIAALAATAVPAGAVPLRSDNVTLLAKLPEVTGAIGARFSDDGKTMYTTAPDGLHIFDITNPELPLPIGFQPLPHFENEDVDVDQARKLVVITNDPSFSTAGMLYVIDVSNPTVPRIRDAEMTRIPGAAVRQQLGQPGTGNGHIANCIQGCRYVWTTGTSEGITVYDLANPDDVKFLGAFQMPRPKGGGSPGFTHDVFVDPSGIAWITGEDGTFGYRTDGDPLHPQIVYRSDENLLNSGNSGPSLDGASANDYPLDFLHHNSMRTSIKMPQSPKQPNSKAKPPKPGKAKYRMGNVIAVTEEDYARPGCDGQGSLQTWQITDERNSDGTIKLKMLDMWTTELNELVNQTGRSPATVMCSAHWFDESNGLLAQGWYDQGVRFMDISHPDDIRQVGYYATTGEFWAAHFAPSDPTRQTVYALDTLGGIDVLHIDRAGGVSKMRTRREPRAAVQRQMRTTTQRVSIASPRWGFSCRIPQVA